MKKKELAVKISFSVLGVALAGVSVGFLKLAAMGVDPFQAMMAGLNAVIPIPFGTLYAIVGLLLLCFSFFVDRHYVGLASIITLTIQGYIIDFAKDILFSLFPEAVLGVRVVGFVIGIVLLCFATAIYFTADLGVSAYDAISLIITNTWKKGKFRYNRIMTDCVCVILGSVISYFRRNICHPYIHCGNRHHCHGFLHGSAGGLFPNKGGNAGVSFHFGTNA